MNALVSSLCAVALAMPAVACGSSDSPSAPFAKYEIVGSNGGAPRANVGDALRLSVVEVLADGSSAPPSGDTEIAWSGPPVVQALPEGSTPDASILPQPSDTPAAMWVKNPEHLTDAELAGVLYVLDAGTASSPTVTVSASIRGGSGPDGDVSTVIPIAPFAAGEVSRGQALYAANCASCHGAHGEGGSAPGLNDEPDHVAGDPGWTPQLLGIVARSNMDDQGVSLDVSMPKWLIQKGANGDLLSTRDFSDVYSFLRTQHGEALTQ